MSYINIVLDGYVIDLNMDKLTKEQVDEFKAAVQAYDSDPCASYIEDLDEFYDTQINADTVQTLRGYYDFALDAYLRRLDDDCEPAIDLDGEEELFFEEIQNSIDEAAFIEQLSGLDLEDGYYYVAQRIATSSDSYILETDEEINEIDPFALDYDIVVDVCTLSDLPTVMGREVNTDTYNILTNIRYKNEEFLHSSDDTPVYDTTFSIKEIKEDVLIIFQVVNGYLSIVYTFDALSENPEHFYDHIDKTLIDMPIYHNNLIQYIDLEDDNEMYDDDDDDDYDAEDDLVDDSYDDYEDDDNSVAKAKDGYAYRSDSDEKNKKRREDDYDDDMR